MDTTIPTAIPQLYRATRSQVKALRVAIWLATQLKGIESMQEPDKDRKKRNIKLGLFFGVLVILVYGGSMYMLWAH